MSQAEVVLKYALLYTYMFVLCSCAVNLMYPLALVMQLLSYVFYIYRQEESNEKLLLFNIYPTWLRRNNKTLSHLI